LKKQLIKLVVLFSTIVIIATVPQFVYAGSSKGAIAPLNPEFQEFRTNLHDQELKGANFITQDGKKYFFGYIPPTVDLSHNFSPDDFRPFLKTSSTYPLTYDLRDHNKVTSVKNQGNFGTCWSFATMASIESFLKPEESYDFSEYHLAWYAYDGINSFTCIEPEYGAHPILGQGGNSIRAIAMLSRWSEPYYESDYPYDNEGNIPSTTSDAAVRKHLQNARFLTSAEDVKDAIINVGAVSAFMFYDPGSYNSTNYAYYYNPSNEEGGGDHCISIVGWNDNFPADSFSIGEPVSISGSTPPGNGA
jgi:C1A family cysteine protease